MEAAMEIKNRQQLLIVLTIVAAALLVGVDFVYTPLSGWWTARAAQIKDLRGRVHDGKMLIRDENGLRGEWANMQTNALPANTSLAEQKVFTSFDDWSRNSGAEITTIMPQWRNDATNYMTLDCRVEVAGDLGMLSKFLYEIESSPMALRVDSVELGSHDTAGQQLTLGLEIDGLALIPAK
jgi:Tfp pilus assembly protein PilO